MEGKTTRMLIIAGAFLIGVGMFTGGFNGILNGLSGKAVTGVAPCMMGGASYSEGMAINGMVCTNGAWVQQSTATTVPSAPNVITTPANTAIPLSCASDNLDIFNVVANNALDDMTQGYSYVAGVGLTMTQGGGVVATATSSSTGSVDMSPSCGTGTVALFALNNSLIYPEDTAVITYPTNAYGYVGLTDEQRRVTYSGETIPLSYLGTDNVRHGMVRTPLVVNVIEPGTLAVTAWDTTGNQADTNLNLSTYHGIINSDAKIKIAETESLKGAKAVVILVDYNRQNISSLSLTDANGRYEFYRDDNIIPGYYSTYDAAFRVRDMTTKIWTNLDASSLTVDPNVLEAIVNIKVTGVGTVTGAENMTFMAVDSTKVLQTGMYSWANGGTLAAEDQNNNNLGITAAHEGTAFIELDY
jgi:hypothetical protein